MGSLDDSVVLGLGVVGLCRAVGGVGPGWGCWAGPCRAVSPAALPTALPVHGSNKHGGATAQELCSHPGCCVALLRLVEC